MSTDGKIYSLGASELSDEQRASIAKHQQQQEDQTQGFAKQQLESSKTRIRATLEQLLQTKIDPEEDRVIVWPDEVEAITEGGIHKPEEVIAKERPCVGTVIAVGPGKTVDNVHLEVLLCILEEAGGEEKAAELRQKLKTIPLTPGMRIMYGRYAGTPTNDPETKEELLIMRPSDIFAKFKV